MTDISKIRATIAADQITQAHDLIREGLTYKPTAELYYLAAHVTDDQEQKVQLLHKALELDPFFGDADLALHALKTGQSHIDPTLTAPVAPSAPTPSTALMPAATDTPPVAAQRTIVQKYAQMVKAERTRGVDAADSGSITHRPPRAEVFPPAPIFSRIMAFFLDSVIYIVIVFFISFLLAWVLPAPDLEFRMPREEAAQIIAETDARNNMILNGVAIIIGLAYNFFFLKVLNGQTPGKMAFGLRIVNVDDSDFGIGDIILRNVIGYALSTAFVGIGYLWIIIDGKNRAWHDYVADTVVIKEQ